MASTFNIDTREVDGGDASSDDKEVAGRSLTIAELGAHQRQQEDAAAGGGASWQRRRRSRRTRRKSGGWRRRRSCAGEEEGDV
jgi:hypothetical protein